MLIWIGFISVSMVLVIATLHPWQRNPRSATRPGSCYDSLLCHPWVMHSWWLDWWWFTDRFSLVKLRTCHWMLALYILLGSFWTIQNLWSHCRSIDSESLEIPKLAAQHFSLPVWGLLLCTLCPVELLSSTVSRILADFWDWNQAAKPNE
jgi:hypothetical protein